MNKNNIEYLQCRIQIAWATSDKYDFQSKVCHYISLIGFLSNK